jgi:two-component system sensor histidine kinase YesM
MTLRGHVIWGMFIPGFVREDPPGTKYISLARSIDTSSGIPEYLCTASVSISQNSLGRIMEQYLYSDSDCMFISTGEGDVQLNMDLGKPISDSDFRNILRRNTGGKNYFIETLNDTRYLVSYYTLLDSWTFNGQALLIYYFINYQEVINQLGSISGRINMALLVYFLTIFLIILILTINIVKPIKVLSEKMASYSADKLPEGLNLKRNDEIGQINRVFYQMVKNIGDLFIQLKKESTTKEQYYFESLRAQMNPHFLFNTLTAIRWMALIKKEDNIVDSIDALANILKYSMNKGNELVALKDELSSIESYIEIQNYRYGCCYTLKIDLDQNLWKLRVIKFILQPIVENAIIYAFRDMDQKGEILIYGHIEEGKKFPGEEQLKLFVEDNGSGIDDGVIWKFRESRNRRDDKKVTGIGLVNVDERIRIQYGEQYGISMTRRAGKGTVVTYTLPVIRNGYVEENPAS